MNGGGGHNGLQGRIPAVTLQSACQHAHSPYYARYIFKRWHQLWNGCHNFPGQSAETKARRMINKYDEI